MSDDPADTAGNKKSRQPTKKLPTDRLAFEKQKDLLRGWVAASGASGKPVGNQDVAGIVKMAASTVSLANSFFVEAGLLERVDSAFVPTDPVRSYARFHEYMPETAGHKLAPLFSDTWFGKALLPKLSFRPLSRKEAIATLADESQAGSQYESKLEFLLEYLQFAGLVELEGDQVKGAKPSKSAQQDEVQSEKPVGDRRSGKSSASVSTGFAQPAEGLVQFHIDVRVDMAELGGWSPERISAFFAGIAQVLAAKGRIEETVSRE